MRLGVRGASIFRALSAALISDTVVAIRIAAGKDMPVKIVSVKLEFWEGASAVGALPAIAILGAP